MENKDFKITMECTAPEYLEAGQEKSEMITQADGFLLIAFEGTQPKQLICRATYHLDCFANALATYVKAEFTKKQQAMFLLSLLSHLQPNKDEGDDNPCLS